MTEPQTTPRARRRTRRLAWALVLVAAGFAAWSGWSYQRIDQDALGYAQARDEALEDGRRRITELNSMDGGRIDEGLRRWLDASTGLLHDELRRTAGESRRRLQSSGTSAEGTVTDAAVTALDTRAGTAQIIASVQVKVTPRSGAPSTERRRYEAGMVRTSAGWKLRSLTAVPVRGA
ncbi:hypothetical protein [Actinomadura sp. HBU206391]|uniref:hypothetical protein n=1 Tax=Actinomadura sp. HBU206391 TaxID=2731692 RepID=UPI00164F34F0|nr:hypothetical protein [Actinomadura sp. HBU206391]MBC6461607.1 hypothetical protein [Actinomadura sp. HBU206391]